MAATETNGAVPGLLEPTTGTPYVVQVLEEIETEEGGAEEYWRDIGTVEVPKRAHRKRAVEEALGLPGNEALRPKGEIVRRFRALDADAAEEIPAGVKVREELVVG